MFWIGASTDVLSRTGPRGAVIGVVFRAWATAVGFVASPFSDFSAATTSSACAYALVKVTEPAPTVSAKTACVFWGIADTYGPKSAVVSGGHRTLSIFPPS